MNYWKKIKKVAITGATGYVAEKLIESLLEKRININAIARNEGDLIALKNKFPSIDIFPCPIEEYFLLKKACVECDGVFHLAAVKGVTTAEDHPLKTVETNIMGSTNVLKISVENAMKFVVGASSDKAERMSGVYGASKYIMEKLFQEFESFNGAICEYRVIRFGNIFYSTGSVLDIWKKAIADDSELLLTDPACTRFFWTRESAVKEMLNSIESTNNALPLVPILKSITTGILLETMIEIYGNDQTKWRKIGIREGENMHETLSNNLSSEFSPQWSKKELKDVLLITD